MGRSDSVVSARDRRSSGTWGAVAQWLVHSADNRVIAGSNITEAAWKLCPFLLPHFASVFRRKH